MPKFWPLHQVIVMEGTTVGGDIWSCSLRTIWGQAPGSQLSFEDQEELLKSFADPPFLGIANIMTAWWDNNTASGTAFLSIFSLSSIKFNSIGHDGKYVFPNTSEVVLNPAHAGKYTASGGNPRESLVITLRPGYDRGRGAFGRIYPPRTSLIYSGGNANLSAGNVTSYMNEFLTAVRAINALEVSGEKLTVANISPGDTALGTSAVAAPVTRVEVDRYMDTQRRRTNRMPRLVESADV